MKRLLAAFVLFLCGGTSVFAGSIVMEGNYQQRNIYVINSVASEGVGFCVYEVTVNGQISTDEINSQAFEVDLSIYGLKLGDAVSVIIKHKDGCTPRVLNPGALESQPTFESTRIECTQQGLLSWETTNEVGKLPFIVQQFKWNKWVNIGEVMGNGTSIKNNYQFQVILTSGLNKFRIVQKSYEGNLRKSATAEVNSTVATASFVLNKKTSTVDFSGETGYELFNAYGQILKKGYGNTLNTTGLAKGEYYLSFDNKTEKFLIK
ncbi:MAG: hypothetical protein SGI87_01070 [Flavobacteriales bacterium]|nr:hypothetical protein [Flavobacteriales bacterium]